MAGAGAGDPGGDGPRVVLAAVDGSVTSNRAMAWAAGLARRHKARLVCVYVAHHSALASVALASSGAGIPMNYDTDEISKEIAEDLRVNARRRDMNAEFLVRYGDPATEIQGLADEVRADVLVVGASMKAGHRLVGSVAVRLVRAARWPITVVP